MKLKTLFLVPLLLLLPGFAVLLQSCGCEDIVEYCHYTTGVTAEIFDNAHSKPQPVTDGAVIAEALLLQVTVYEKIEVCAKGIKETGFGMAAYALTKPSCTNDHYRDAVAAIEITSDKDFNEVYKAGDNLMPLFVMPDTSAFYKEGDYLCYLMHAPGDTGTHTLTVAIKYQNGQIRTASTAPVELLK